MSEPYWVPLGAAPLPPPSTGRVTIPIRLRVPRTATLAGNSAFSVTAFTAWDAAMWEFYDGLEGRIYGHCRLPSTIAATPNAQLVMVWASNAGGNCSVQVKMHNVPNGGSINPGAFATGFGPATIAMNGWSINVQEWTFGSGVPAPAVAAKDMLLFEITRFGASGADTSVGILYLLDAYVEISY